jgi:ubiquinone/menaquinone biosynthesis C-methylase UbiE
MLRRVSLLRRRPLATCEIMMNIAAAYDRWSGKYDADRNLTRDLDRSVTEEILGARRFTATLEAGCGTGKNTTLFAALSDVVIAMDFSRGMLGQAVEQVRADNVLFIQGDLTQRWPCSDAIADLVSCNLVLEHVLDLTFFFREADRSLTPGGLLFLCELHPYRQYHGKQARFETESGTEVRVEAYTHHTSDFTRCAFDVGFQLERLDEWWHAEDKSASPRLISFLFSKLAGHHAGKHSL